jgi:hypothetical protein
MRRGWFLAVALLGAAIALGYRYTIVACAPDQDGRLTAWRAAWMGATWLCVKSRLDAAPSSEASAKAILKRPASAWNTMRSAGHAHLGRLPRLPDLLVPPT